MVRALYHRCCQSYLLADLDSTFMFYDLLCQAYRESGRPDSLTTDQLRDLKAIRTAVRTGVISKGQWLTEILPEVPPAATEEKRKQDDVVHAIHHLGLEKLRGILEDPVRLYNLEHPCGPYGRVDMVYQGERTVYPLEVKVGKGKHDLIGQICKYDLYHRLRLSYGFHERVRSVTVCGSYDSYTLAELKRNGILTLRYSLVDGRLSLGKI